MKRLINHVRGNLVAYVALFVAMGGTSYAATSLPRNSVGTTQLRKGSVTASKLDGSQFRGRILAVTELGPTGNVIRSNPGHVTTSDWASDSSGLVDYPSAIPRDCSPVATPTAALIPPLGTVPQVAAETMGLRSVEVTEDGPATINLMILCEH